MNIVKHTILTLMALMLISIASCSNDPIVKNYNGFTNGEEVTFTVTIPGYALPTRADEGIDPAVESLHLYLFDNQGHFTGIVEATQVKDPTKKDDVLKPTDLANSQTNTTATYSTSIPQNTDDVHFIANLPNPGNAWIEKNLGYTADAVIPHLLTDTKVYWGKSTFGDLTDANGEFNPTPVVLYRNYAKVKWELTRSTNSNIVEGGILGWTLCNVPTQGTVAPFDISAVGTGGGPFHFSLTTEDDADRFATMPLEPTDRTFAANPTDVGTDAELTSFDHTATGYGKKMYAVFKIKTSSGGKEATKYYKIALIDSNKDDYDIKRNHVYTITFKDINPELGYDKFEKAATDNTPAANDNTVDIQEILPELQSDNATLSVVNGTVRYIDNLTTTTQYEKTSETLEDGTSVTKYQVNDIYINYTGTDNLKVTWKEEYWGKSGYIPETGSLTITKADADSKTTDGKPYTHVISFYADAFEQGNHGENHYKEGLIRVAETNGPLSRFVRVYIGESISFRPLLISNDIPALTDERISIVFNVPDSTHLPSTLYPIEIRFGSDRVDVEKNIYVESMKVEETSTSDQYENVLEWKGTSGSSDWNWKATGTITPTWNHKYVYTLNTPEEAVRQHRITLRTINNSTDDFSVLMEGLSTVLKDGAGEAEAKVFNTRELKFHMQTKGDEARRIMLDDGMYETRLVTAYKYAIANASGQTIVSIPYTLGTFDSKTNTMTPATETETETETETGTGTISTTLWVYYDPDVLVPCDENGNLTPTTPWWNTNTRTEDPEGNTYVTVNQTTATGTLHFQTVGKTAENSLVFITARSEAGYGTYNDGATSTTTGYPENYINTGENAAGSEYRSASAIINVKDKWQFNPAPSTTNSNFAHAEEFTMPYGRSNTFTTYAPVSGDNLLYVRIERPAGKSDVKLEIETEGKFQLLDNTNEYAVVTENNERCDGYKVEDGKMVKETIKLTLTDANSDYCVLKFRALNFSSACTITLKSANGSSVPYETDYLKIVNEPISIDHIAYMTRAEYESRREKIGNYNYVVKDDYFVTKDFMLNAVPRAGYVVRVYLPNSVRFALADADEMSFDYLTLLSDILPGTNAVFSASANGYSDNYEKDGSTLTYKGVGKVGQSTANADLDYVDILLQSKVANSAETARIESSDDETIGLNLYRHSLSFKNTVIEERDAYEVWFKGYANNIMTNETNAVGQEVFKAFGGYIDGTTINAMGTTFKTASKFNSDGNISIAVPEDNMYLTVVAAMKSDQTSCAGFNVMTLGTDGQDSFTGEDDYADDIDKNGTAVVYQLGTAGEYILRRKGSGAEFPVYYARLSKADPRKNFTISWKAEDTNSDSKGGTTSGTVTNNRISVSDFHEKLTLTIPLETTATLNLSSESQYKFEDGSYTQSVTPTTNTDGESIGTVTLVPVTTSNGELVDGTFTLSGSDANGNVYNAQTIEVYVRPYVTIEGLNIDYDGYIGEGYVQVGKTFNATVTIPNDVNTVGKEVVFSFPWASGSNGTGYISQESVPAEYVNGKIAKENVIANKVYTFTWKADVAGADKQMILQARNTGGETDIVRNIKNNYVINNSQNLWPYLHTIDDTYVMVGVGEYSASVKYWDVKVTNLDGTKTYLDGNGSWTSSDASQPWTVSNGTVSNIFNKTNGTHYARRDFAYPNTGYKFTCKAMKTDDTGGEGFIIIFDHTISGMGSSAPHLQWNIGGWGNSCHTIEGFSGKAIGSGYGNTDSNGDGIDDTKAYPSTADGKDDNTQKLVTVDVTYNIEITVENDIATCICTPNKTGEYYMEYVFNMSTGKRISCKTVKMSNTYEYYITDSNISTEERYKHVRVNGVAQTAAIDVLNMNGAHRYRSEGGPITVTPHEKSETSLTNGEHMGYNNQYITLNIPYPMTVYYKWVPIAAGKVLNIYNSAETIVTTNHVNKDGNSTTNFEVNKAFEVKNQRLLPGTYTLKSGDGETVLWYLKLSPYTP